MKLKTLQIRIGQRDSLDELHAMADRIGIKRKWFQADGSLPHYDICKSKRKLAVAFGAIEIGRREIAEMVRKHRYAKREARLKGEHHQ